MTDDAVRTIDRGELRHKLERHDGVKLVMPLRDWDFKRKRIPYPRGSRRHSRYSPLEEILHMVGAAPVLCSYRAGRSRFVESILCLVQTSLRGRFVLALERRGEHVFRGSARAPSQDDDALEAVVGRLLRRAANVRQPPAREESLDHGLTTVSIVSLKDDFFDEGPGSGAESVQDVELSAFDVDL